MSQDTALSPIIGKGLKNATKQNLSKVSTLGETRDT